MDSKLKLIKIYLLKKDKLMNELLNLNKFNSRRRKQIKNEISDLNTIISDILDERTDIFTLQLDEPSDEESENDIFCKGCGWFCEQETSHKEFSIINNNKQQKCVFC
jgi:hypothetical protein